MALTNFILTVGECCSGCRAEHHLALPGRALASPLHTHPNQPSLTHAAAAAAAAVGVGAVAMLMSKDVRQSSAMLRRNMRHIRSWLEEQGAAAE